jgi:secondary thiamine-phosphate synthase enzyme
MRVVHLSLDLTAPGPGLHEITGRIARGLRESGLQSGVATVFCRHTSSSLVLMENASPEARRDLEKFFERLVPPNPDFEHALEGPDDMPSHIKMALTRSSESIPFAQPSRQVLVTYLGE